MQRQVAAGGALHKALKLVGGQGRAVGRQGRTGGGACALPHFAVSRQGAGGAGHAGDTAAAQRARHARQLT